MKKTAVSYSEQELKALTLIANGPRTEWGSKVNKFLITSPNRTYAPVWAKVYDIYQTMTIGPDWRAVVKARTAGKPYVPTQRKKYRKSSLADRVASKALEAIGKRKYIKRDKTGKSNLAVSVTRNEIRFQVKSMRIESTAGILEFIVSV